MEVRGCSKSKEGPAGTPNTDSPLARGGQGGDIAQILSSQKKKKMARNRKRESCQLEAGCPCPRSTPVGERELQKRACRPGEGPGRNLGNALTCTPAERLVGIEHGGEKAKGKSTDTKREVEAPGIAERLEPLGRQEDQGNPRALAPEGHSWARRLTPRLSGAGRWPWGRGGVLNLRGRREGISTSSTLSRGGGSTFRPHCVQSPTWDPGASGFLVHKEGRHSPC